MVPVDARPLGQILLIESLVAQLPNKVTMLDFAARGLELMPGIRKVWFQDEAIGPEPSHTQSYEIHHNGHLHAVLRFEIADEAQFSPYIPYIKNLAFMLGIVFDERLQREENERYRTQLESLIVARTQALAKREFQARSMLSTAMDGVWLMDAQAYLLEVNEAACAMLGYQRDEMVGMRIDAIEVIESWDEVQVHMSQLKQKGTDLFESRHRRKDGSELPVEISVTIHAEVNQAVVFVRDITERKRAQEMLRESHELFSLFMRHSPVCAFIKEVTPTESRVLVASDNFKEMIGITGAEMVGKTMAELFPADFAAKITADDWAVVTQGEVLKLDEDLNGRYYTSIKYPILQNSKTLLAGYTIDITDRVLAQQAMQESEARFNSAFQLMPVALCITTLQERRFVAFNRAFEDIYGYTPEDLKGQTVGEVGIWANPEDREQVVALLFQGQSVRDFETPIRRKDGAIKWVSYSGERVNLNGVECLLSGAVDITQRRAHERELLRMNHLYDMLSQLGQTLIRTHSREELLQEICTIAVAKGGFRLAWVGWVDTATQQVLPVAKAGEAIGYLDGITISAADCPEGRDPMGICIRENRTYVCQNFSTDPAFLPWRQKAQAFGLIASLSVPIRIQGEAVGALMIYSAEPDAFKDREVALLEEAAAHVAFGLDHLASEAQRRKLESELAHTQKMESLGSLAGGVAHDMNNVLGAILGLASLQMDQAPEGSSLQHSMETISKACMRGATLMKGLLGFARQGLAEEKILDLNTLVREEVALLERTTLQKVRLDVQLAEDLRAIRGDPGALSHALMNLCVNAVDAMPEGGTLALITRNEAGGMVLLEVADAGSGMSKEVLDKAMDPFFTTKPQGKGTGLGLSIVYATVKAHRGRVELQSEPGKGTRVFLRFPSCQPFIENLRSSSEARPASKQKSLLVLLVDDDELIQHSMPELLKALGHAITTATSGEEALAKIEGGLKPDVVILDVNMPGMGGSGALPRLRTLLPTVPILLATGRVDQAAMELSESHPNVTLLGKPFDMMELQQQLESLPVSLDWGVDIPAS